MSLSIIAKPNILLYGDTFGKYGGQLLTDTIPSGDLDVNDLNKSTVLDGVEFNRFELAVKDYILARLGHPVVRVELTSFQLKICIEEAINKFAYHAPFWNRQFAAFDASAGINQYELPAHIAHNLSYVNYRKTLLTINAAAGSLEFDFFLKYFQDNFVLGDFRLGDYYLLQSYLETARKVLGQEGSFDLVNGKVLQLYPAPAIDGERVILEYRAVDSNTIHPAYRNWIQKYSLAIAKGVLGEIRGKYRSLPSPGGGAILNGDALSQASVREKETLEKELMSEIEEPPVFTMY